MKSSILSLAMGAGLLGIAANSCWAVDYVRICPPPNEPGFYVVPGFAADAPNAPFICLNPVSAETRQSIPVTTTTSVVWKSLLPYAVGNWVSVPQQACDGGRPVKLGTFQSTDFMLNSFQKLQTPPVTLQLKNNEFITKVVMTGGFYDPRIPARQGTNGSFLDGGPGLCLRSMDGSVLEAQPAGPPVNPPYGNGGLPIGCVADRRIANMPLSYAISATAAYPSVDAYLLNGDNQLPAAGPYVYGKQLVVTTDVGPGGPAELRYCDPTAGSCGGGVYSVETQTFSPLGAGMKPMAGSLSVLVCVNEAPIPAGALN